MTSKEIALKILFALIRSPAYNTLPLTELAEAAANVAKVMLVELDRKE